MDKPGYKTTELYVTLIATVISLAVTYNVFTQAEAESWLQFATALINVMPSLLYTWSRTRVKQSLASNGNGLG